jgi:hypothetical protein
MKRLLEVVSERLDAARARLAGKELKTDSAQRAPRSRL